ncbi:MAG: AAA family ATPase [Azospirillum sp.]|nr:AAA family ATPase [Azospirillum sp.]
MPRLTDEQARAMGVLTAAVAGRQWCVLEGYAGTGKTTLITEFAKHYGDKIVLTAPTNKAVKVLREKARVAGLSCDCTTIYKLLGVRPGNTDENRALKKEGPDGSAPYDVIVIDECSMVPAELNGYLQKAIRGKSVIFVGDPKQLPPVQEELSQTFMLRTKAVLSTIMRQREDNPIISLTADLRSQIDGGMPDMSVFHPAEGNDGVGMYQPGSDLQSWLVDAFMDPEFAKDNDNFRYLAWTNGTVNAVNKFVRGKIYGENADRFLVGERLLFRKPVFDELAGRSIVVFSTDEEAVVKKITISHMITPSKGFDPKYDPHGLPVFERGQPAFHQTLDVPKIKVWALHMETDDGREGVATVVHEDDAKLYSEVEQFIKGVAREHREMWPFYFWFMERFAEVQPVYAMTVHRSQGSTFDTVFIDLLDIAKNRNRVEMLKLLYVAASRPRRFLVF